MSKKTIIIFFLAVIIALAITLFRKIFRIKRNNVRTEPQFID